jgi:hypothetical protein
MVVLLQANSFFYGIGITILVCAALWLILKFLLSRGRTKLNKRRYSGNSNRATRRKEQALSRRRRG